MIACASSAICLPVSPKEAQQSVITQAVARRVVALRGLVARAAEGAFLLRILSEHNLGRLAARCDEATQRALRDGGAYQSFSRV